MIYKEFILNDLFCLENGNKLDKNKMSYKNPVINFVSRTAKNNGISDLVDSIDKITPYPAGCLTLAFGGSIGSCFLQEYPFYTGQNVGVIKFDDNISYRAKLYIKTVLEKICKNKFVAFGDEINKHFKTDLSLLLPVIHNLDENHEYTVDDIDWNYMENYIKEFEINYIKELETNYIKELETYLSVTGLDDYHLTDQDKEVLNKDVDMKEFKVRDIFEKRTVKGVPKRDENLDENINGHHMFGQNIKYQYPQKIMLDDKYLQIVKSNYPILAYTSSVGEIGIIEESFYRSGNNGAFQGLFPKYKLQRLELLYILAVIKKHFNSFNYTTSMQNVLELSILLPADENGEPDFEYMEKYIRAIEKQIIAKLYDNNELILKTTKEIVGD